MGLASVVGDAEFILQVRCIQCLRDHPYRVTVGLDGGPLDLDEFLASHPVAFRCEPCGEASGKVIAVRRGSPR